MPSFQPTSSIGSLLLIDWDQQIAVGQLNNEDELNASTIAIELVITSSLTAGSVVFDRTFNGVTISRTENDAPWALFGDSNGNFNPWTPPVGEHEVTATVYSQSGGLGQAVGAIMVRFRVLGTDSSQISSTTLTSTIDQSSTASTGVLAQPSVTTIDNTHRNFGHIFMGQRTAFCAGNRTLWFVGHNREPPLCETGPGLWENTSSIREQMFEDNDRHDCESIDVNNDGIDDIICATGAMKGQGARHDEVFQVFQNGSYLKLENHGLGDLPTMRSRSPIQLTAANGDKLILMLVQGVPRDDGQHNMHRMYRLVPGERVTFLPVPGPWEEHYDANSGLVFDFDNDGLDDILVIENPAKSRKCGSSGLTKLYLQSPTGAWRKVELPARFGDIRAARVRDVTGDQIADIVLTTWSQKRILVFKGLANRAEPFFDFTNPYFRMILPQTAEDIELLDVNSDGLVDIYVPQIDADTGKRFEWSEAENRPAAYYCGARNMGSNTYDDVPRDQISDLLLVGQRSSDNQRTWAPQWMDHQAKGCGRFAVALGGQELALAHGTESRPGQTLILRWT